MKILYLGDIMGKPGRNVVTKLLPALITERGIDFVVAQGENLSHGKGLEINHVEAMMAAGINAFTAGNWTSHRPGIIPWLEDPAKPLVRCANYPEGTPGRGYKIVDTPMGKILIASLLGQVVGYIDHPVDNPLHVIDKILEETKHENLIARVVNFHGDFSSEKLVIGRYLDGRATLVVGDHWHVPTADAKLLPGGTAHITDVGMVGSYDSCLGVQTDVIIKRWLTDERSRNELEESGQMWLCGVLIDVNTASGQATTVEQIIKFV
ncbi:YmdB family metallophosphoesterase [Candidatus Saccharibacteria bacterium]|nr:YmdB family metallophosphoesterase [Candidatus Saccharibacteria bacterium]